MPREYRPTKTFNSVPLHATILSSTNDNVVTLRSSIETQDFIVFLCLYFLSQMLHLNKNNGLWPVNTVAELQHNRVKELYWSASSSSVSEVTGLTYYSLEKRVQFCSPIYIDYNFTAQMHFALSNHWLLPWQWEMLHLTVLLGFFWTKVLLRQHSDFKESRSDRESSVVLP